MNLNSINVYGTGKDTKSPVESTELLGESIIVYMRGRASDYEAFHFKVTGAGTIQGGDFIDGYDSEALNMRIDLMDIDFVKRSETKTC